MSYKAPTDDIFHAITAIAELEAIATAFPAAELTKDLAAAIIEEAGKYTSEVLAPLNMVGDSNGTPLCDGVVTMPPGFRPAYQAWVDGGWNALPGPMDYGGQGLPTLIHMAVSEMTASANLSISLAFLLNAGAAAALHKHGSSALKEVYLPNMISGTWAGTMNLTEPGAGSDLSGLVTRAERRDDGTYRIKGQKIYISFGEHDLTDNIIHLVLARLPDAPAGTRGISLFLVPKVMVDADGSLGARNDVHCHTVEHKLGIHASPTCTLIYGDGIYTDAATDGAIGYLIGQENQGLRCMFTMMNNARLGVGIQGVAVAEAATQKAIAFAHERRQGHAPGSGRGAPADAIVAHPDVARMLLTMRALTQTARAICYSCAQAIDLSRGDAGAAPHWQTRADLLTPIAKAFATDIGIEVASLGIQVHGGMGYVEETGAAQYFRDARIAAIYEGTNGIQAIDLVTRKLPLAEGRAMHLLAEEHCAFVAEARQRNEPQFADIAGAVEHGLGDLIVATDWLLARLSEGKQAEVLSGATPYLELSGLALGGGYLLKSALHDGSNSSARASMAAYFADHHLVKTSALRRVVESGAESVIANAHLLRAS